jgi:malonyl-CoA O-methyltransferase
VPVLSTHKCFTDEQRSLKALDARQAYPLWAPTYSDETAISFLEDRLVRDMTPPLTGARLLDVGCGTGRRVRHAGAASAFGLEPCREMLAAGAAVDGPFTGVDLGVGDVRDMPLSGSGFDVVWCRLVLGHLPKIAGAYAELARVADDGATVIVSDFHPAAADAGHRRSFRAGGRLIEVEHHVHSAEQHIEAAQAAGLDLQEIREAEIGDDVRPFYARAGRLETFSEHVGLPIVLALAFRKER